MQRRRFLAQPFLAAILVLAAGHVARAATEVAFTGQAFAQAQAEGKPILVDIWASWCPTCAAQAPTLGQIKADPAFKDLLILKVDFDTQKDVVRQMGARMQSTLIAFHGSAEKGRSTGDTNAESIKALVAKALVGKANQ